MTTRNCWVPVGTRLPPRLAPDFVSSYFTQDADSEGSEGEFFPLACSSQLFQDDAFENLLATAPAVAQQSP